MKIDLEKIQFNIALKGYCNDSTNLYNCLVINVLGLADGSRVDLQDFKTSLLVRQRNLNLPVQTTWTKQSRIEGVRSIRRHDQFRLAEGIETVHLV